jgi:hypothetical protein
MYNYSMLKLIVKKSCVFRSSVYKRNTQGLEGITSIGTKGNFRICISLQIPML